MNSSSKEKSKGSPGNDQGRGAQNSSPNTGYSLKIPQFVFNLIGAVLFFMMCFIANVTAEFVSGMMGGENDYLDTNTETKKRESFPVTTEVRSTMDKIASKDLTGVGFEQQSVQEKVLIVFKNEEGVQIHESLMSKMPDSLASTRLDSVRTIVVCKKKVDVVGEYTNGGEAKRITEELIFIDANTFDLLWRREFKGGPPKQTIRRQPGSDLGDTGSIPSRGQMVEYILKSISL